MTEDHSEALCVVLLDPEVNWLKTAHIEKQLGLLQRHRAAGDTGGHINYLQKNPRFSALEKSNLCGRCLAVHAIAINAINPCVQHQAFQPLH